MANLYDKASLVLPTSPAYKDGAIQAYKPLTSQGTFDFSRGSNLAATRVDVNGLIEKGRENLSINSQNGSAWTKSGSTINTTSAADLLGGNDAVTYTADGGGAAYVYSDANIDVISGNVYTGSVYVKNVNANYVQLTFGTSSFGSAQYRNFDLTNGTLGGGLGIDGKIENVGGGWYRISITASATASTSTAALVVVIAPSASASRLQSANNGQRLTAFGIQLEKGLVATDYIETGASTAQAGILEDMPRLDYSGDASCPSLLLEPSRTNLLPHSEYIGDGGWTKNGATITTNYATSPEGVQNASLITFSSGGYILDSVTTTKTIGAQETISVFSNADISGTFLKYGGGTAAGTDVEGREVVGNGWFRYYVTRTFTEAETASTQFLIAQSNVGDSVLIYGAQLESGSYPTSYIPTYGSSVTRSGDLCNKTGISNLIGQTEGTLFLETTDWQLSLDTLLFSVSDGSISNYIQISTNSGTGNLQSVVFAGGGGTLLGSTTPTAGQRLKIAVGYKVNDYAFYVNGTQIGTLTSKAAPSSLTRSDIGSLSWIGSGLQLRPKVAQAIIFNTRLSNAELQALTTL